MSEIYFTSDLHLGHEKIALTRGFATVEEHDAAVAERWRSVVRPHDIVHVLGDVAMHPLHIAQMMAWSGRKRLVSGNHDWTHPANRKSFSAMATYSEVFEWIGSAAQVRYESRRLICSHFPYDGDSRTDHEDRMSAWRMRDLGQPIVHGHTHSALRTSRSAQGTLQVHVGVDAWDLTPVAARTVIDLIDTSQERQPDAS